MNAVPCPVMPARRTFSHSARLDRLWRGLLILCAGFLQSPGLHAQTPSVGAKAPDFALPTPAGAQIRLSEMLRKQPVVLIVLRGFPGYQCPYCQKQVHDFVDHAPDFAAKQTAVLLVYPGPPGELDAHAKDFLTKQPNLPANITLVIDPDYKVINQYGLRWDAPHETAYPSTFILNQKRNVVFEKISHGHGDRTSAQDVLNQLPAQ